MKKYLSLIMNNKQIALPMFYLMLLIVGIFIFNNIIVDYLDGFKVIVNKEEIAIVKNINVVKYLLSEIEKEIEESKKIDIIFDEYLLDYYQTESTLDNFTSLSDLETRLKENLTYKVKCWTLNVAGKNVLFLSKKNSIEALIKSLKEYYIPLSNGNDKIENININIEENYTIKPAETYLKNIMTEEKAFQYLLYGTKGRESYEIKSGDNLYSIARYYNITLTELEEANPHVNPQYLPIGGVIQLAVHKPLLNVDVTYRHIFEEIIYPEVWVKWDDTMLRTETIIEEEGEAGSRRVFADMVLYNGIVDKEKSKRVKEEILQYPKTRIERKGTCRTPDDILVSGAFLPPGIGIITSPFGPRWGRFHAGIDVTVPTGTNVLAFRSGIIKFAGWHSYMYGILVIIEHENGYETYYGHNSAVIVKPGQKVNKGDLIALSGSTGFSTGPHVHFEIRENGIPIDPLLYLHSQ